MAVLFNISKGIGKMLYFMITSLEQNIKSHNNIVISNTS